MTVELGDDDGTKVGGLLESARLSFGGLSCGKTGRRLARRQDEQVGDTAERTDGTVQHENAHVGLHSLANLHHLLEELALLTMATRSVDDDDLEALRAELGNTSESDGDGIRLGVAVAM